MSFQPLPSTMRALVCEGAGQPLVLRNVPTPQPTPGSVVVKVLTCNVDSTMKAILNGDMAPVFEFPVPLIPGCRAVGRIASRGPDTTTFEVGQLVLLEPYIRARDNPNTWIFIGGMDGVTPQSKKLMADNWRDGAFADYVRMPLENCWSLDEPVLCGKMGYSIAEIGYLTTLMVAFAALGPRGIDLKAGEKLIVAPATGHYSGAAVAVATALGASVIAVGRNRRILETVQALFPRVDVVQLTGNVEQDSTVIAEFGSMDAYIDISPARATGSNHVRSCFKALRDGGRAALAGGIMDDISLPYVEAVFRSLTIKGSRMYERADVKDTIRLVESGVLSLGKAAGSEIVGRYQPGDVDQALEHAFTNPEFGKLTVLDFET